MTNVVPLLEVRASFTTPLTPGIAIQSPVNPFGLEPVAVYGGADGEPVTTYGGGTDSVTPSNNDHELGTFAFLFARDVATADNRILTSDGNDADGVPAVNAGILNINSFAYVWNGASWDRVRGTSTFHTVSTAAVGNTPVWTPAVGKKFRVLGGEISICGTLAALGVQVIKLTDGNGGTVIKQFNAAVAATITGDTQIPFSCGNGYLSTAANNPLVANLGTAMTGGSVVVNVYGVEE